MNKLGFYHRPYLRCVWLARSEPWSRPERPGSIPPSGNESSLARASGCRCGCSLWRAKSTGLVCLWWPAAGAGTAKEPRLEHLAPWVWTKTHASSVLSLKKERSGPGFVERLTLHLWWESGEVHMHKPSFACLFLRHLMNAFIMSWDAELSIWKGISQGRTKQPCFWFTCCGKPREVTLMWIEKLVVHGWIEKPPPPNFWLNDLVERRVWDLYWLWKFEVFTLWSEVWCSVRLKPGRCFFPPYPHLTPGDRHIGTSLL